MAKSAVFRRIALAALVFAGGAAAIPAPDDFVGPPSFSLMGCSYAAEWTAEYVRTVTGFTERQLQRAEQKFGFTPDRICASEPQLIEGMVNPKRPKSKEDEPDKALAQRILQLVDSDGTIPDNALQNALSQRQQILEPPPPPPPKTTLEKRAPVQKVAGISQGGWTWIG